MASADQMYVKFGQTAEAAQLFETDLSTIVLAIEGRKNAWHISPNVTQARAFYERLNRKTLGQLLQEVGRHISLDDDTAELFNEALNARNLVNHGFFERHNFAIQTEDGRQGMIEDLDRLHSRLHGAWKIAQKVAILLADTLNTRRAN